VEKTKPATNTPILSQILAAILRRFMASTSPPAL
jgi:hypothetical protein